MSKNPLIELNRLGQSFWYDNISRGFIKSGELGRMIREDGLRGITSNPSIFYKSIKSGTEYNELLNELSRNKELSDKQIFYELAFRDIEEAADLLLPVYRESKGEDGFVSIEVDPSFAYKTDETVREAAYLFSRINRKNVMIKVPATPEGLPAVRALTGLGINVNVTLLFSVKRYEEVMEMYLQGIEERVSKGLPADTIASVASFFVSRVDSLVDKLLEEKVKRAEADSARRDLKALMGKAAIANAKKAYQAYKNVFSSERFLKVKQKGAKIQRLLWGSTSTKNPAYSDVLYVDELIGPGTINTIPSDTVKAFRDHGKAQRTIDRAVADISQVLGRIESAGISLDKVTSELEADGVKQFKEAFDALIQLIKEKRK